MKTLYININNEQIQSNDELEVVSHDLDADFFFHLGCKIAKGCKVENENALITDFNTPDTEEDYKQIIAQWNELKNILFSEKCEGNFELTLPNGYIHWLHYNEKYNSIYDKNFSHSESAVITIDLEELYEESVEYLQRNILRSLKKNDLYLDIDEIVFNDDAVTRKSSIVCTIKDKYEGIGFKPYKKRLKETEESLCKDVNYKHDNCGTEETSTFERSLESDTDDIHDVNEGNVRDEFGILSEIPIEKRIEIADKISVLFRDIESNDGLYPAYKTGYYGFIDEDGKEVTPFIYDDAKPFSEGLAVVTKDGINWGVIDTKGNIVVPFVYDRIYDFKEGRAAIMLNDKMGFIDKAGKGVVPCIYDPIYNKCGSVNYSSYTFHEGLAGVCLDGKSGFIDMTGKEVIPFIYDDAKSFSERLAPVKQNDKWGYIDITGKNAIPYIYDDARSFSVGVAPVKQNDKWGYIDKIGQVVIPFIYDDAESFSERLAPVKQNDKWGYIDITGKDVIPFIYEMAYDFRDGLAKVSLNERYGVINKEGINIVPHIAKFPHNVCRINRIKLIRVCGDRNKYYYDFNGELLK